MSIHVTPHDRVEFESAYVAAAKSIIKARAMEKKLREFKDSNPDGESLIKFIAGKAFSWANDYDWDRARGDERNLTPRTFFDKIHLSIMEYGAPTQGQADAVRRIMVQDAEKKAQWAARDAQSQHVGTIGERIEIEAVVTFQTSFESAFGMTTITGFRSGDNVLIHKGTNPLHRDTKKGDRVILKATIKAHGERDGVKQTTVSRPKVTKVEVA
jgi:hypothetical protein